MYVGFDMIWLIGRERKSEKWKLRKSSQDILARQLHSIAPALVDRLHDHPYKEGIHHDAICHKEAHRAVMSDPVNISCN